LIFLEKKAIAFWMQVHRKMGRVARGRGGGEKWHGSRTGAPAAKRRRFSTPKGKPLPKIIALSLFIFFKQRLSQDI